jgi:hypothetical protein
LLSSSNIIRAVQSKVRWEGHGERIEEMRNIQTCNILVGQPEEKRPLGTWR